METISPEFTKEEKKQVRILAANEGLSMRVWVRREILKIIEKSKKNEAGRTIHE